MRCWTQIVAATGCLAAVVSVSGCGSDAGSSEGDGQRTVTTAQAVAVQTAEPLHKFTVVIQDAVPLGSYFNKNNHVCVVSNMLIGDGVPLSITVRDQNGTIIGHKTSPRVGGNVQDAGCQVPVVVKAKSSDYYEIELSGGNASIDVKQVVDPSALQVIFNI